MDEPMATVFTDLVQQHVNKPDESERALVFMSNVVFPWRMLYAHPRDVLAVIDDDAEPGSVDDRGFLGIAGIVDHMMPITSPNKLKQGRSVPIGIYTGFEKISGGRDDVKLALAERADLKPRFESNEAAFTKAIVADESALIYTFCHGRFRSATGGNQVQELLLTAKPLTGHHIRSRIKRATRGLSTGPIAFVNACQGGVFKSDYSTTVIDALRQCGASGTAGPLLDMPIRFGGVFGTAVLKSLTEGGSLASSLLKASRHFMAEERNPLGLAYQSINGRNATLPMLE